LSPEYFQTKQVKTYIDNYGRNCPVALSEAMGMPMHPLQRDIADLFTYDNRQDWFYISVIWSRRIGKSALAEFIALSEVLTPCAHVAIITHSSDLADEYYAHINKYLSQVPNLSFYPEKKRGKFVLNKDTDIESTLIVASENTWEQRFVGKNLTLLVLDETFLWDDTKLTRALDKVTPAGLNYGSNESGIPVMKTISFSTPRKQKLATKAGRNHYKGERGEKGHKSFFADIYQSPFLSERDIETYKASSSESTWNQEYLCLFDSSNSTVLRNFNQDKHVKDFSIEEIEQYLGGESMLIASFDPGAADGGGFLLIGHNTRNGKFIVLDEWWRKYELSRIHLEESFEKVDSWQSRLNIPDDNVIYFSDPAGLDFRLTAQRDFDRILNKAKKSKDNHYDTANDLLAGRGTENPEPDLVVLEPCQEAIRQFQYAEFKLVGDIPTKNYAQDREFGSHWELVDCLVYALYSNQVMENNTIILS